MTRPDLNTRHGFADAPTVAKSYKSPLFWTVMGRDFGRSNLWSRIRGNPVAEQIKQKLTQRPSEQYLRNLKNQFSETLP